MLTPYGPPFLFILSAVFRVACSDSACHEENLMYNGQTASVSNARYNNTLFQSGRFILFYFPGQLLIVRFSVITPGVATGPGCRESVSLKGSPSRVTRCLNEEPYLELSPASHVTRVQQRLFHASTRIPRKNYSVFSPLLERTLARYLEVVLMRTDSRPRKDIIGVQQD